MRILTTLALSAAFTAGIATAASACSYNRTAEKKQTIAQTTPEKPATAVSTFQPVTPKQLEQTVKTDDAD